MSVESDNKQVVRDYYRHVSAGERDAADALLADDATWWIAGKPERFALAGERTMAEHRRLLGTIASALPHGVRVEVRAMTAEGDRVAAETETHGISAAGTVYDNRFHMLFVIRDGKIVHVREYLDTLHAKQVLLDGG
jgi:uncharacterized protein